MHALASRLSPPARVGATVTAMVFGVVVAFMVVGVIEPYDLITPGGRGPSAEVIARDFGDAAVDPDATGYDGQQTYAIARDFPDLDAAAKQTDSARYRMLRILPAIVAWPAPSGTPTVLVLLAVNAVGFGLAVTAAMKIASPFGVDAKWAIVACTPLLLGVFGTTTGPIGWGLALVALERTMRNRHLEAVAIFTLAALCRESVAAAAGFAALGLLLVHGIKIWRVLPLYAAPGLVVAAWFAFLTEVVGGRFVERVDPLGFLDLKPSAAVVPGIIFLIGAFGAWAWRREPVLAIPCLGYTAWMAVHTPAILDDAAIIRVNALSTILGILGVAAFARDASTSRGGEHVHG